MSGIFYEPPALPPLKGNILEDLEDPTWHSKRKQCKFAISQCWRFFLGFSLIALGVAITSFWKPKKEAHDKAPQGLCLIIIMAGFWIFEILPLAITSLIPVVLVPVLGIDDSEKVCGCYFNEVVMFLLGSCIFALAFEYSSLHRRFALFMMKSTRVRARPGRVLFITMFSCTFLSSFMNNTFLTAMVCPIVLYIADRYRIQFVPLETPEELADQYGLLDDDEYLSLHPSVTSTIRTEQWPPKREVFHPEVRSDMDMGCTIDYWEDVVEEKKKFVRHIELMLLLGVAFSSNIGGTGVITGTVTNLLALDKLKESRKFIEKDVIKVKGKAGCIDPANAYWEADFLSWALLNFLPMIINTFLSWLFIACYFQGIPWSWRVFIKTRLMRRRLTPEEVRREAETRVAIVSVRETCKEKYRELGKKLRFQEWIIIIFLGFLIIMWLFRNPMFFKPKSAPYDKAKDKDKDSLEIVHPKCLEDKATLKAQSSWGWARFFGDKCDEDFIHDYVITWLVVALLCVLPRFPMFYKYVMRGGLEFGLTDPCMPLHVVTKYTPWDPVFLVGGSFAVANAITASGLGSFLEDSIKQSPLIKKLSVEICIGVALGLAAFLTMIVSNSAAAVIITPIVLSFAQSKSVPPLYFVIPPIVSCSYAFMLPISTPSNAIVYARGKMKHYDMIIPGFFLTIICNAVLFFFAIALNSKQLKVSSYKGVCDVVGK